MQRVVGGFGVAAFLAVGLIMGPASAKGPGGNVPVTSDQDTATPDITTVPDASGSDVIQPDATTTDTSSDDTNSGDTSSGDASSTDTSSAAAPVSVSFSVSVPSITATDSSVDEVTLKDILSGDIAAHADALASLNATDILIPEYDVNYTSTTADGTTVNGSFVFHNIDLAKIANGVAATVSIDSTTVSDSMNSAGQFGKISAEQFDIGGLLAFYGLIKGDSTSAPRPLYSNFHEAEGSITTPQGRCDIGQSSMASLKARPLKMSFPDFLKLANEANAEGNDVTPETTAKLVGFIVDVTEAIDMAPIEFSGLRCTSTTDDGKTVDVNVGAVKLGEFANGRYPDVSVDNVSVVAPGEGSMSLGNFLLKGIDFSNALTALNAAGSDVNEQWFTDNYRQLIPQFGGFAFSGFNIDIPDEDHPSERIQGSVANFDLSLKNYVNGVPTDISSSAQHVVAFIPPDSDDDTAQQLLSLGINSFDVGYDFAANWDEADQEIHLDKLSVSGSNFGSLAVAAVLGNATRDLFATDTDVAANAGMAVTLKRVSVDMHDSGLADLIYGVMAKRAGQDPKTFRAALAALTQGTLLVFIGGAANAQDVTKAVADFINGAKSLSVVVTSKDPAGVSLQDFEATQDDPSTAVAKVNIDAHAE